MRLFADSSEGHGSCDEMLDNILHGLHLLYVDGVSLEVEEVAQEDWSRLVVYK